MRVLLLTSLLFIGIVTCKAQSDVMQIEVSNSFWGLKITQDGQRLTLGQAQRIMEPVPAAFREMKNARTNTKIAAVLAGAGGFMVGWSLASAISDSQKTEWALGGIGLGVIGVSIPIGIGAGRRAKNASATYNEANGNPVANMGYRLSLGLCANRKDGIGLVWRVAL